MNDSLYDYAGLKESVDIGDFLDRYFERAGDGYVCPECGSGTKSARTGALKPCPDRVSAHCFACGFHGDIFDLAGLVVDDDNRAYQYQFVKCWAEDQPHGAAADANVAASMPADAGGAPVDANSEPDYTEARDAEAEKVLRWAQEIERRDPVGYLSARGIDLATAKEYRMGYDDASGRVIIPYPGSDYYHIDRLITGGSTNAPKYIKPKSSLVGPEPIWNPDALEEDCFFVVEGPFDAIAVQSCGYPAVALCGTGHDALVKALIDKQYQGTVVIMLDCDLAGIKAACSMEQKLFDSKIKCGIADIGDLLPEAIRAEHLKAEKARRKEASGW